ncbi:Mariner Mos1 transposase [Eumeta japonica]|uniref:Mariner Mos1 transposase n=1 Tax=Eumeta variegata TaxID=151549 RepID=A0A4C1Y141_EUMVA|nr:Mariner Mos1 transposase [Eumeta japonica]
MIDKIDDACKLIKLVKCDRNERTVMLGNVNGRISVQRGRYEKFGDRRVNENEDKDRCGRPKICEYAELEELLEEDLSPAQKEFALTLEVTQQAVSHRLKSLGMIHKQISWLPYKLKPKDIECRLCMSEMLLARHKEKNLHRIVTGDEKWLHYDNPKRRKSGRLPDHASTSTP